MEVICPTKGQSNQGIGHGHDKTNFSNSINFLLIKIFFKSYGLKYN